jgi:hypothetical protein
MREREKFINTGVDGRIILKYISKEYRVKSLDYIHLA